MAFSATWEDLEMIVLSEVSQTEKDKHHLYVKSEKRVVQVNLLTKQKETHRLRSKIGGNQRGRWGRLN